MNNETFKHLAPFIKEYIYAHNWKNIRPVQVEACEVIFNTNAHLLLAAGTASGKTDAPAKTAKNPGFDAAAGRLDLPSSWCFLAAVWS